MAALNLRQRIVSLTRADQQLNAVLSGPIPHCRRAPRRMRINLQGRWSAKKLDPPALQRAKELVRRLCAKGPGHQITSGGIHHGQHRHGLPTWQSDPHGVGEQSLIKPVGASKGRLGSLSWSSKLRHTLDTHEPASPQRGPGKRREYATDAPTARPTDAPNSYEVVPQCVWLRPVCPPGGVVELRTPLLWCRGAAGSGQCPRHLLGAHTTRHTAGFRAMWRHMAGR